MLPGTNTPLELTIPGYPLGMLIAPSVVKPGQKAPMPTPKI